MQNIAAQARKFAEMVKRNDGAAGHIETANVLMAAADEIEKLWAEVERLSVIRPEIIKAEAEYLGLVPKAK